MDGIPRRRVDLARDGARMKTITNKGIHRPAAMGSGPSIAQKTPARHGRDVEQVQMTSGRKTRRSPESQYIMDTWARYKEEPTIYLRDILIAHYMERHVRMIAERFRTSLPPSVDIDDLIQQGYLGLVRCIERFQPERGIRFETFSSLRIVGAMRDWLREQDHIPRQARQRSRMLNAARDRFRITHGRSPDTSELVGLLDLSLEDALACISASRPPAMVTFSTVMMNNGGDDNESSELSSLTDNNPSSSPLHDIGRSDLRRWLTRELESRDQLIVVLYYYEDMTMREIGMVLGCSESRVSQRLNLILQRLRSTFNGVGSAEELIPLD